jgi:hypothetical protein
MHGATVNGSRRPAFVPGVVAAGVASRVPDERFAVVFAAGFDVDFAAVSVEGQFEIAYAERGNGDRSVVSVGVAGRCRVGNVDCRGLGLRAVERDYVDVCLWSVAFIRELPPSRYRSRF